MAATLAALTWAVFSFPDGQTLSRTWRVIAMVATTAAVLRSLCSALWPVEHASADLKTGPPFSVAGEATSSDVWRAVAHPAYSLIQLSWLAAVVSRWRRANGILRNQLAVLGTAVGLATLAPAGEWSS